MYVKSEPLIMLTVVTTFVLTTTSLIQIAVYLVISLILLVAYL
jgi:hypothetical protein